MTRIAALLAMGVVASGCFTPVPPAELAPRSATTVAAPPDRAWNAAVDLTTERHLTIRTIDRASGLILVTPFLMSDTGSVQGVRKERHAWADCGQMVTGFRQPTFAAYTFRVRGDGAGASVLMTIEFSFARNAMSMAKAPCTSRGVLEAAFEQAIKARAEKGGP